MGNTTLGTGQSGSYGTETNPALVYAYLGDNERIKMHGSFQGYGTLFIDVGRVDNHETLIFDGTAGWKGLVVLHFRDSTLRERR